MEKKTEKTKVYNVIIMDRSGSMWDIQKPAIQGFNEVPGACTPLYDAMGRTLIKLENELKGDENHSVVVTVITDGYENASREYSLKSIKALVEHLKDEGWSFAYMGTDHDVHGVSVSLSITNVIKFEKTEQLTLETFRKERRARDRWYASEAAFSQGCPEASYEDRIRAKKQMAARFYDEDPVPGQADA